MVLSGKWRCMYTNTVTGHNTGIIHTYGSRGATAHLHIPERRRRLGRNGPSRHTLDGRDASLRSLVAGVHRSLRPSLTATVTSSVAKR